MTQLYDAFLKGQPSPLAELPLQYGDYAVWQRQWLQGEVMEQQLCYWRRQLGGELPVLELPTDRPRPAVWSASGAVEAFVLPPELGARLQAVSRQRECDCSCCCLRAIKFLWRYSGQTEVLVGTAIANRTRRDRAADRVFFEHAGDERGFVG